MNKNFGLIKNFFLVGAPILASSFLGVSPSKAATFALSESVAVFENFSQNPSNVNTFALADVSTSAMSGSVTAEAEAIAIFSEAPAFAINSNFTQALGENQDYLASAESESQLRGVFDIEADTNFSFDFESRLNLETSIDNPPAENARASGDISFFLFDIDNNTVLDFFNLSGNLVTEGDNDFIVSQISDNVNLSETSGNADFEGNEEFLEAFVEGSYKRKFENETNLALIEIKRNRVTVQEVPEPSISLALLVSSGIIGVVLKRRRK